MTRKTLKPWGTKRRPNVPNAGRSVAPTGHAKEAAPSSKAKEKAPAAPKAEGELYTEEELEDFDMKTLRIIGEKLDVADRSKAGLIRQILRES